MILVYATELPSGTSVATATELLSQDDGYFYYRETKVFSRPDGNDLQTTSETTTVSGSFAVDTFQAFFEWGNDGTLLND